MRKEAKKRTVRKALPMVVIRSSQCGVFAGELAERDRATRHAVFRRCVRLWAWQTADGSPSVSGLAAVGIDRSRSKLSAVTAGHEISDVLEVIPMQPEAVATLGGVL